MEFIRARVGKVVQQLWKFRVDNIELLRSQVDSSDLVSMGVGGELLERFSKVVEGA